MDSLKWHDDCREVEVVRWQAQSLTGFSERET